MTDYSIDRRVANNIRALVVAMVEKAQSGHPGGAMGAAEFIHILYSDFLKFDPDDPFWPARDRFFLDPGHMSPMLYAQLALLGKLSMEDLMNFRQLHSPTPGHPEVDVARMIENTSGPLGQGHVMAVGAAIAERFLVARLGKVAEHKTIAFLSDGGIQEEIAQGAGRIAGFLGLHNLILYYDANKVQLSTRVEEVTCEDTAMKYRAWGWKVIEIDGNDPQQIREALTLAWNETQSPTLIIGHSVMGKGIKASDGTPLEGLTSTHGQPISKAGADVGLTLQSLGADPLHPFIIYDDVKTYYQQILQKKVAQARQAKADEKAWAKANPGLAADWINWLENRLPEISWNDIVLKPKAATRVSSAEMLAHFSGRLKNMLVMSADLANSDRTDGFLKNTQPIRKDDFSGGFLHVGVSELTMAALANGMALHGGIIPVCGTFFVFSDYMKPAIRLAALMQLHVIYVWTHDSFRVGEDGPTHQPIEQEAQIRLMESLKNHKNQHSLIALRPADWAETLQAWKYALENTQRPTALILSRQDVNELPVAEGTRRREEAAQTVRGAYLLSISDPDPEIILLGNGSDVGLMTQAALILKEQNRRVAIVSCPSIGLLMEHIETNPTAKASLLPAGVPILAVTAGLPDTWFRFTDHVMGMETFGFSAPSSALDAYLGFTPEKIAEKASSILQAQAV
ncbi:MAG: transketolase family protein [Bacteroidales bacterium]